MELTVGGCSVVATTGGRELNPDLPLMVFVHGAGLDRTAWQLQTRYFSHHGYSVLAVDLPQHGRSNGTAPDSIERYADWIAEVIGAAGYQSAHVVGHSMGVLIALEAAATHPQAVSALILGGATSALPVHPELLSAAEADDHLAYELMTSWGLSRVSHRGGHPTPGLWMVGSTIRLLERTQPGVLAGDLHACNNYRHGLEAAAKVMCPTLLITGSLDVMAPPSAAGPLCDLIADAEEVVLEGAGHIMMFERPDPFNQVVADFLVRRASPTR